MCGSPVRRWLSVSAAVCVASGGMTVVCGQSIRGVRALPTEFQPHSAMWRNGSIYTSNAFANTLQRLDPVTGEVLEQHHPLIPDDPEAHPHGMTSYDDGTFWVVSFFTQRLYRLRGDDYGLVSVIDLPPGDYYDVTYDGVGLWLSQHGADYPRPIVEIDPSTGAVLDSWLAPAPDIHGLAWDGRHLWALTFQDDRIFKLNRSGHVLRQYAMFRHGFWGGLAFDGRYFWSGEYYRMELAQMQVMVAPDLDVDGDVDLSDFGLFKACALGPAVPYQLGCEKRDFDMDGDIDQSDWGEFQVCYSGQNEAASPACEP